MVREKKGYELTWFLKEGNNFWVLQMFTGIMPYNWPMDLRTQFEIVQPSKSRLNQSKSLLNKLNTVGPRYNNILETTSLYLCIREYYITTFEKIILLFGSFSRFICIIPIITAWCDWEKVLGQSTYVYICCWVRTRNVPNAMPTMYQLAKSVLFYGFLSFLVLLYLYLLVLWNLQCCTSRRKH